MAAPHVCVVAAQAGAQVCGDEQDVSPKLNIVTRVTLRLRLRPWRIEQIMQHCLMISLSFANVL